MYDGVPMTAPVRVWPAVPSSCLARPKSVILAVPSFVSRTLAGFRSRWMTPRVSVGHGPCQGGHQLGGGARRPGGAVQPVGQAAALDQLQGEVRQAVALADLVNLHDIRVLQARDGLGLGAEARQLVRPRVAAGEDHLERPPAG